MPALTDPTLDALRLCLADEPAVLVSVLETQGSVPREAGTWMAVFAGSVLGTIGGSLVRRMLLTGYRVPAAELYRRGVIEACVPQADLMATVMETAKTIASKSPVASRIAKHSLATIEGMGIRDGYRFEQNMTAELGKTDDSREAMRAFAEKRPPVFKGK